MNNIFTTPVYKLEELKYVYIVLTAKNCNQRCKQCYIDFPMSRQVQDFIDINRVKEMLEEIRGERVECIYLTGGEPMTHPQFNNILRLCLKRTNVCICTNASFINEKKSRFLKKVEDESRYKLLFRVSMSHYEEGKNDGARYRGAYRQTLFAVKNLERYGLSCIVEAVNYYNEPKEHLMEMYQEKFTEYGINPQISFVDYINKCAEEVVDNGDKKDCMNSRTLSNNGVYACPKLAEDYRGRVGGSFKNYSKSVSGETGYCSNCSSCEIDFR